MEPLTKVSPHIERAINLFIEMIETVLDRKLIGFYLYGSLCHNAYREGVSDIDFLAVVDEKLTVREYQELEKAFYLLLPQEPLLTTFEGNILPIHSLHLSNKAGCPQCYDGQLVCASPRDWNAVTLYLLYEKGITISGPSPVQLLPAISQKEVMKTMRGNLLFLENRMPVYASNGLEDQVFGVLTLCRIFYTARTGEIVSKREAALYAISNMDSPWRELVRKALVCWNVQNGYGVTLDSLQNLLRFVEYVKGMTEDRLR